MVRGLPSPVKSMIAPLPLEGVVVALLLRFPVPGPDPTIDEAADFESFAFNAIVAIVRSK